MALGVGRALFHEHLSRARDSLEAGGIDAKAVLDAFSLDPSNGTPAGGDGNALGIPALALGIARGGELAGGIGEQGESTIGWMTEEISRDVPWSTLRLQGRAGAGALRVLQLSHDRRSGKVVIDQVLRLTPETPSFGTDPGNTIVS